MPSQPLASLEDLLRQLPLCTTAIEHLLDAQPTITTVMAAQLRQALALLVPASPPDPDAVFLNEYVYDTPSTDTQAGTARVARLTRTRSLTQVLLEAIVTQTEPTKLAKEPQTGTVEQAVGFYAQVYSVGRSGEITALEVTAFNQLISDLQHDCWTLYSQQLEAFWTSPHATTGALSVLEAVSQKQRQVLTLEADLKRHDAQQQATQAELALTKAPTDTQAQTAVATAKAHQKMLTEGRQLIENLVLHETSVTATPPQAVSITLYSTDLPEWSAALNGCFVLTERLYGTRPAVLYTPQFGVEIFEHFAAMGNALHRRLVSGAEKSLLLTNVALSERSRADDVLSSGQNLRYTAITGPVFSSCLRARLDQQEADIDHAFSASHTTFEALATALRSALALPLKGSPGLLARLPVPVEPSLTPHTSPDTAQQTQLIQLWACLNQQIDDVLDLHKHPSLESALNSLLKETFPQLPADTGMSSLYVNRYRTDSTGVRQFESSRTLLQALCALLRWDETDEDEAEDPTAPADSLAIVDTFAESVFSSPTAFSETDQITQNGTLLGLAETLQARLAAQVTTYWRTPITPERDCPQVRLIALHRQALDVQARLRVADNTLSPQAKLLIDRVRQYPTQARREAAFSHGARPGVYQLRVNNVRLAGSFVLTPNDGSNATRPHWPYGHKNLSTRFITGPAVVFTPDQGFEECTTLQALHDRLKARIDAGEDAGKLLASGLPLAVQSTKTGQWGNDLDTTFTPIQDDFVANSIQAMLDKQQSDIETLLGLSDDEPDPQSNGRTELVELLDMAGPLIARNQLLLEHWRPDWEKGLSPANQKALQGQAQIADEKQEQLGKQWKALVPTLGEYAKQQVLLKIRAFLEEKGADGKVRADYPAQGIDPDKTMVIRTTRTRTGAGAGFGSVHEGVDATRTSLTNLLLTNNKPWEKSLAWTQDHKLEATLINAQGGWVRDAQGKAVVVDKDRLEQWVKELNIGHRYTEDVLKKHLAPDATATDAQALKKAWIASQASALDYAGLSARLSPDAYSTTLTSDNSQKKAAAWMAAVLASPDPATRQPVDGQAVIASALLFNPTSQGRGGYTVNGVLIVSTAIDESVALYTPQAPDGLDLREITSEYEMFKLMRTSPWQTYFQTRLTANTHVFNLGLAEHTGDVLAGLYRQNYLHLLDKTDNDSVTNEELNYQSTKNKVLFGIDVVTTVLGGFPWAGHLVSSTFGWLGRMSRTTVHALRSLGQTVAGLALRRTIGGRVLFEVATATTMITGATRTAGVGIKPLQMLLRPAKDAPLHRLTSYERAFRRESVNLLVKGGIPAGSSLSERAGIYKTSGASPAYLVQGTNVAGKERVFRVQGPFNLSEPRGMVAPLLTPTGGATPFKLRLLPNKQWALDTGEALTGGAPKVRGRMAAALKAWAAHVADVRSRNPQAQLDPKTFFADRAIPPKTWDKYVRLSGEINAAGRLRLNPPPAQDYAQFTDELFNTWVASGEETAQAAALFLQTHRLNPSTWARYVTTSGKLTEVGRHRLIRVVKFPGRKSIITDQHLLDWDRLYLRPALPRATPITKAQIKQYALDNHIHIDSWLKYVSPKDGAFHRNKPTFVERLNRLGIPASPHPPQTAPLDLTTPNTSQPPV